MQPRVGWFQSATGWPEGSDPCPEGSEGKRLGSQDWPVGSGPLKFAHGTQLPGVRTLGLRVRRHFRGVGGLTPVQRGHFSVHGTHSPGVRGHAP